VSYAEWRDEVRRLLAVLRPGFSPQLLNPNECFAAWKAGTSPNDFVQNGASHTPIAGSAPTPHAAMGPSDPGQSYFPVAAMWGLTAVALVCGAIGSILYGRGMPDSDTETFACYAALLDLPACVLAFFCLARRETSIHGLAKLGWEIVAGISVYFLVIGIARDRESAYHSGYSKGESTGYQAGTANGSSLGYQEGAANGSSQGYREGAANGFSGGARAGYADGYTDGFNAGAEQQLSHDRAAVGGYGY